MKNVAQKFLPLALVIIVALYGVLAVPPLSNSEIAVAISPSGEGVGNSAAPNSDDIFGFDEDPLWYLTRSISELDSGQIEPLEPAVANLSSDLLSEERARIIRELDSRRDGLRRWVGDEIDRTKQKIQALDSRIEAILPTLTQFPDESRAQKNRDKVMRMIYPVVQLRGNGTVGSGVVLKSEFSDRGHWNVWIVTAYHVVEEVRDLTSEEVVIRELRFFDPDQGHLNELCYDGYEVASLPESDLSLIRVERSTSWPYVAVVADEKTCRALSVFDPVYAVGCPLGNQPLPTLGQISSQHKPVGEEIYWMVNAPTYFGNSGGGIFLAGEGELIGISSMIYTYGKRSPMVVPHMGLFVPFQTVRSWLRREGYAYLIGSPVAGPVPAANGSEQAENVGSGSF